MPAKNAVSVPAQALQKELEQLYARRTAIDDLIESLERYGRFPNLETDPQERRTV